MTIAARHGINARIQSAATSRAKKTTDRAVIEASTEALEAHRAEIEARGQVRTITLPRGDVRIRPTGQCPFCSGAAFRVEVPILDFARPRANERGSIVCQLCSRVVAVLRIGGTP